MMTRTKVFSKDYLMDELDLPYDNTIVDRIVNTTRWSIIHEIVFEDNGKFYMTTYSEGATECQDERPWEYDDEIKCYDHLINRFSTSDVLELKNQICKAIVHKSNYFYMLGKPDEGQKCIDGIKDVFCKKKY